MRRGLVAGSAGVAAVLLWVGFASPVGAAAGIATRPPTWRVVSSPTVAGTDVELRAVTCVRASDCWAVGYAGTTPSDSKGHVLIEHSAGVKWSVVAPASLSTQGFASLQGIGCSGGSLCWAVGSVVSGSRSTALLERWNGSAWNSVEFPKPGDAQLRGVACTTAKSCFAVGSSGSSSDGFIESWDGTSWRQVFHGNLGFGFDAVSCPSTKSCFAVGGRDAVHWNGRSWTEVATPAPLGVNLNGVSCTSASMCRADGDAYGNGGNFRLSILDWNGERWSTQRAATRTRAEFSTLEAVSCVGSSTCWTVGSDSLTKGVTGETLAEGWSSRGWLIYASPDPYISDGLVGVECLSSSDCWAVGWSATHNGGPSPHPVIEQYAR